MKSGALFGNKSLRSLHRDIGYFSVGLVMAFCTSGIALNHRTTWNPVMYKYAYLAIPTEFRMPKESVTSEGVRKFSERNGLADFQTYDFRGDSTVVVLYKHAGATIHLVNGRAEANIWRQRPVLSQLYYLHVSFQDDNWYKWYSDIFALGLLTIAVTGMFLVRGRNGFRRRGWIFALAGIAAPIVALLVIAM